jgi:hypothetical protein
MNLSESYLKKMMIGDVLLLPLTKTPTAFVLDVKISVSNSNIVLVCLNYQPFEIIRIWFGVVEVNKTTIQLQGLSYPNLVFSRYDYYDSVVEIPFGENGI